MRISDWSSDVCSSDLFSHALASLALKETFEANDAKACEKEYSEALGGFKSLGYETVDVAYPDLPSGLAGGISVEAERQEERRVGQGCGGRVRIRRAR